MAALLFWLTLSKFKALNCSSASEFWWFCQTCWIWHWVKFCWWYFFFLYLLFKAYLIFLLVAFASLSAKEEAKNAAGRLWATGVVTLIWGGECFEHYCSWQRLKMCICFNEGITALLQGIQWWPVGWACWSLSIRLCHLHAFLPAISLVRRERKRKGRGRGE